MACKKTYYQAVKINRGTGVVETLGDPFDFAGDPVDVSTLVDCPEARYESENVCITTDGVDCQENVTRNIKFSYDCATEVTTTEVLSYLLADGSVVEAADFVAPYAVIPCPEFEILTDQKCEV